MEEVKGKGRIVDRLFAPVDVAVLVYFRVVFGGILLWEVCRYWVGGWTHEYWVGKAYHYKYYGFEWVQALPGEWPHYVWVSLAIPAAMMVVGLFYRTAATWLFLGYTYFFLLDQTDYQNHPYLICLLAFMAILIPANGWLSVDARLNPGVRRDTAPAWTLWMLKGQLFIVYFFGGLAKLNADWMGGEPMRSWLLNRVERVEGIPPLAAFFQSEIAVYFFSWGGALFDLLIVPALMWKRTRVVAFAVLLMFHLTNSWLFEIGIFPWFGIATALIFFDPSWPRKLVGRISEKAAVVVDAEGGGRRLGEGWKRLVVWFLVVWFSWQVFLPLRHFLYPGSSLWTDEGHRFAWQMRLRMKLGSADFYLLREGSQTPEFVDLGEYIDMRQYARMRFRPEMILQTAHWIGDRVEAEEGERPAVVVVSMASLNGRPNSVMIDPRVDLGRVERNLWPAGWIVSLEESERIRAEREAEGK
ncbi:MAG: HTTM domain-containing protein [Verrucomicrobiota bacterium]